MTVLDVILFQRQQLHQRSADFLVLVECAHPLSERGAREGTQHRMGRLLAHNLCQLITATLQSSGHASVIRSHLDQVNGCPHLLARSDNDVPQAYDIWEADILAVHHPLQQLERLVCRGVSVKGRDLVALRQSMRQTVLQPEKDRGRAFDDR